MHALFTSFFAHSNIQFHSIAVQCATMVLNQYGSSHINISLLMVPKPSVVELHPVNIRRKLILHASVSHVLLGWRAISSWRGEWHFESFNWQRCTKVPAWLMADGTGFATSPFNLKKLIHFFTYLRYTNLYRESYVRREFLFLLFTSFNQPDDMMWHGHNG